MIEGLTRGAIFHGTLLMGCLFVVVIVGGVFFKISSAILPTGMAYVVTMIGVPLTLAFGLLLARQTQFRAQNPNASHFDLITGEPTRFYDDPPTTPTWQNAPTWADYHANNAQANGEGSEFLGDLLAQ